MTRIELTLEVCDTPDALPLVALRRLLKGLLRAYGLKCIDIKEQTQEPFSGPLLITARTPFN